MITPRRLLLGVCVAATLTACGGEEAAVKNTLTVAQGADAKTLDPHATNDQPSSRVAVQIYSQLVETDADMNIVPGLAERWESIDADTTAFHLRPNVMFHNGEALTASDVKFTFERMMDSPTVSHIVGAIDSIDVIDEDTVHINTKAPFGPLLHHLTHTASSILNEKAVTEAGDNYGQHPVGTGPYQFVSWAAGDQITLKAFDNYYGGKPIVENVIFRNIPEGTNRTIALETGEADLAYDLEPIDKDTVLGNNELRYVEEDSMSVAYLGFNTLKGPFANVKVRQAIAHAINPTDIINAVLMGAGTPANSPIGPRVFGHNNTIKAYSQNYAEARQLMVEAGYPTGFKTTIWTNDNPTRVQIAQVLQAQLKEIGIDVSVDVVEWGAFLDGTSRGRHEMFLLGWVSVTGDADYGLFPLFHSSAHGSGGNRSFYSNDTIDGLLERARASTDAAERVALYHEAQSILQQELPSYSLYNQFQNTGMRKNVEGFRMNPAGHHRLRGVRFSATS